MTEPRDERSTRSLVSNSGLVGGGCRTAFSLYRIAALGSAWSGRERRLEVSWSAKCC